MRDGLQRVMPKQAAPVITTAEEQKTLEGLASSRIASYRRVRRARLTLLAAQGMTNTATGEEVDLSREMAVQWRRRFARDRLTGLVGKPRRGRPRMHTDADRLRVVETACTKKPPGDSPERARPSQGHWSRERHRPPDPPRTQGETAPSRDVLAVSRPRLRRQGDRRRGVVSGSTGERGRPVCG